MESQRLFHCASYNAPNSMLTDKQKQMCCDAVQTFNLNGCFCGWGSAAAMNPWTRDVLIDLASALHSCNVGVISCMTGEEYLRDNEVAVAYTDDEVATMQSASTAVSRMVAQDGWSSGGQRLPERLVSSLQPLFDLTFLTRPQPTSYSQEDLVGDELAPGDFDIDIEVEQEGADSEQLSATLAQLSRWIGALLRGDDSTIRGDDVLVSAKTDTLGGVMTQVMQLVNAILNGTDAQVEVAVEITVETTTTTSSATRFSSRKDIAGARPLISRVSTAPIGTGPGAASRVERMVTETSSQPLHAPRSHCWMQRLAAAITKNPARIFAVLAGIAFCVLLAALIAQVQRQMAAQDEEELVTNPLLAPELTTPLLNARGELHGSSF